MKQKNKSTANYKDTINLPKTNFSMKANLIQKEPQIQKKWDEENLYGQIREARAGAPKYILHDGPPYPTGDLHIGTGLNKVLKDIIVKYRTMRGYDAPYVPGWDCHGLPIEHRVMQELGDKAKSMSKAEIRKRCKEYAERFVELQKKQFKGLGVTGDWENPYLTLQPDYEAGVIDVFAKMVDRGFVYRSLKAIHWCMECQTALAEAELEYEDVKGPSIFVNFKFESDVSNLFNIASNDEVNIMIWTTTPWTLPANLAVALHPDFEYSAVRYTTKTQRREVAILADALVDEVMEKVGGRDVERLGKVRGRDLEGKQYRHVFTGKLCPVILANYVALSDTGCVHTAPGHGQEDFLSGVKYGLEILSPVNGAGVFTAEAGEFEGLNIIDGNKAITRRLEELGALLRLDFVTHSYPHCWRCKKPVIFRATEQWFVNIDHNNMRQKALEEIKRVKWIPSWGEERISNMVAERPDWCISRQRSWGVPIPAFYCKSCNDVLVTKSTVEHVRDVFREKGADSWFNNEASMFLPDGTKCTKCGSTEFEKESDIFDVWFESGSSHHSVVQQREELAFPADMYLEGTDQHRGWFQLSLLPSMATQDCAPFKTVLTHGFVVDEKGEKMSKSLGNFISVEDALKEFGGDIIRLWTSSLDYRNEMNVSRELIKRMSDAYRRIRNTFRYLLGNLYDFDPAKNSVDYTEMLEIDRWALSQTQLLIEAVTNAFDDLQFHRVYQLVHNFCAVEMSSFYLDILKDRLYTWDTNSQGRRSAQTAMHHVLLILTRLCAPIIVHTAEEVWSNIEHKDEDVSSVHLTSWPQSHKEWANDEINERWDKLIEVRAEVSRELEKLRAQGIIGSSLEATVSLWTEDDTLFQFLSSYKDQLSMIFITSDVNLVKGRCSDAVQSQEITELFVNVEKSPHEKCERCWQYRESVGANSKHPTLCGKCVEVISHKASPVEVA